MATLYAFTSESVLEHLIKAEAALAVLQSKTEDFATRIALGNASTDVRIARKLLMNSVVTDAAAEPVALPMAAE